ncbi:MAG: hypothetical protein ABSB74_15850 [Tepidisphaeraceae bacterium]
MLPWRVTVVAVDAAGIAAVRRYRLPGRELGRSPAWNLQGDCHALLAFADKHLPGKLMDRRFDGFHADSTIARSP